MSCGEQPVIYACLALHDDGIPITTEKINTLLKAANVTTEPYWAPLFVKLLEKRSIDDLILSCSSGGGGAAVAIAAAPTAGGAAPAAAAAPVEEKKEEPKEESDDDMGFSLFD
ncbi:large subunit ribosomal protein LP1 protein [Dioscorea alata]|uniref:Large subunit ribosomal protein LP1 protein n=1 Tax=Dioscorea alata TaxID=55571 RepID=A0ACB7WUL9_DIOAL|nr:large subunit ribosomal protein LP1 protein [Dioscorea alata]